MFMMIGLLCIGGVSLALAMSIGDSTDDQDDPMHTHANDVSGENTSNAGDGEGPSEVGSLMDYVAAALQEAPEPRAGVSLLSGTACDDTMEGGAGDEFIVGGAGNDELLGGAGPDVLIGSSGDDIIVGDVDDDSLYGGSGEDALHGRAGDDLMNGGSGKDSLFGGEGNDILNGGASSEDYLIGAAGEDVLITGRNDHAYGDAGSDTFVLFEPTSENETAKLADFDPVNDHVVVLVRSDQADAVITLTPSDSDPEKTELRVDGEIYATLATVNAPRSEDVELVVSSADAIGSMR